MKKTYFAIQSDVLLLLSEDVLTASVGDDHGMGGGVAPDEDWQIGLGNITVL